MSPAGDAIRIDTKGAQPKLCSFLRKAQSYYLKKIASFFQLLNIGRLERLLIMKGEEE